MCFFTDPLRLPLFVIAGVVKTRWRTQIYIYTAHLAIRGKKMGKGEPEIRRADIRMVFPEKDPPAINRYDVISNIKVLPSTAASITVSYFAYNI